MAKLEIKVVNTIPETPAQGVLYITKDTQDGFLKFSRWDTTEAKLRTSVGNDEVQSVLTEFLSGKADVDHTHQISDIVDLQATLETKQPLGDYASPEDIANKQEVLISGENIKTINGESILGEGDLSIQTYQDHGQLLGLEDDDHPQYFNQERGDARYSLISHLHSALDLEDIENYVSKNYADVTYQKIADLQSTIEDIVSSTFVAGTDIDISVDPVTHKLTISTTVALDDYATNEELDTHTHEISDINNLEDVLSTKQPTGNYITNTEHTLALSTKQEVLVSGENIKKLAGVSLLGSGNIELKTVNNQPIVGSGNIEVNLENVTVTSVAGRVGDVVLTKADVGLGSVDNTADIDKIISTPQQNALDEKLNKTGGTLTGPLILANDAADELEAVSLRQVNAAIAGFPIADNNGDVLVKKQGDTMDGPLTLHGDASSSLEAVPLQQLQAYSTASRQRENHVGTQEISTIDGLENALNSKQELLVSGENIKTIFGQSILGSDNLTVFHGSLLGLDADSHTHYFNQERGDARYQTKESFGSDVKAILVAGDNIVLTEVDDTLEIKAQVTASVNSVNGKTGDVVLTPEDISAEPSGTAAALISAHESEENPHDAYLTIDDVIAGTNVTIEKNPTTKQMTISASVIADVNSVNGLTGDVILTYANVDADQTGTAENLLLQHVLAADPHPTYINYSRGDARYSQLGHIHTPSDITDIHEYVEDTLYTTLNPSNSVIVNYDDVSGKISLGVSVNPGSGNEYVSFDCIGSVANQTHSFKLPHSQDTFEYDAYALKQIPALTNQNILIDDFKTENSSHYTSTSAVLFNDKISLFKGESGLILTEGLYEKTIKADGLNININAFNNNSIVPSLTSNSDTGYVVSASSYYNDVYVPWHAFDGLNDNYWHSWTSNAAPSQVAPQWLKIELPVAASINGYVISNRNYNDQLNCITWELQASNDDVSWVTLHSVIEDNYSVSGGSRAYNFDETEAFKYYRVYITKANGSYASIGELKLVNIKPINIRSHDGRYFNAVNGVLTELTTPFETGFYQSGLISYVDLEELLPITLVAQGSISFETQYYAHPQIVMQNNLVSALSFSSVNSCTLTTTKTGGGVIRCAVVAPDLTGWMVYKNNTWNSIGILSADTEGANILLTQGMTPDELNAITKSQWEALFGLYPFNAPENIAFAYAIDPSAVLEDTLEIKTMYTNVDYYPSWKKAASTDVEIKWTEVSVEFKTLTAGNYKLAFQVPAELADTVEALTTDFTQTPQDLVDGYFTGLNQ